MLRSCSVVMVGLFLTVGLVASAQDASVPPRRVAVLAFKNLRSDADTDWVGAVTADTLTTKLTAVKVIFVIERENVNKVIQEQHFQESDLANPQTAVKAGRILGAQSVVIGSFAVAGKRVRFNAHIVDVETSQVLQAATLAGDEAEVIDLPVQLADAVIESLSKKVVVVEGKRRVEEAAPVKLTDEERKKVAERPTQNEEAYQAYGRGVDLDKNHRWKEAQAEFQRATELDPGFALAWLQLGRMHYNLGAWPKALESYAKAEVLFQAKGDKKNLAWALRMIGVVHCSQGRYPEGMRYYEDSLAISRRLGDEQAAAKTLNNIGGAHSSQGRYEEAMRQYEESLAIKRRLGDEPGAAATLDNIGIVRNFQDRYPEAMRYSEESLAIRRRLGDEPGVAKTLANIGSVHNSQGRYPEAMRCFEESLAIRRKLGDEPGVALALVNIGIVHNSQGRYPEAMRYYEQSLAISRGLGDEPTAAKTLHNMAVLCKTTKEYDKGLPIAREAAALARKIGFPDVADYDTLVADLERATMR